MGGLDRTWQGRAGHDMASQGMQGVAHMAGSDHVRMSLVLEKLGISEFL